MNTRFHDLKIVIFAILVIGGLLSTSSYAAPVIYEDFDYSDGTINGVSTYGGGTGLSGFWAGSTTGTPFSMSDGTGQSHGGVGQPGLSFGSLSTSGSVTLTRKSAPGGAEVHRTISPGAISTITGSTSYFSVLVRTKYYSIGNENLAFAIGSSDVFDPNSKPVTSGGEALGFALKGGTPTGNEIDFQALAIDDGVTSVSAPGGLNTGSYVETVHMIVGKMEWGATDTITLYSSAGGDDGSTGDTDWSAFSEFASLTASVDESAFDTLHVAGQQVSSLDEIRFGGSLGDVGVTSVPGGNPDTPEPSTIILTGLGLMGVCFRRRRR